MLLIGMNTTRNWAESPLSFYLYCIPFQNEKPDPTLIERFVFQFKVLIKEGKSPRRLVQDLLCKCTVITRHWFGCCAMMGLLERAVMTGLDSGWIRLRSQVMA